MKKNNLIALDVGEKRIGVASASLAIKIAIPLTTIDVDGNELQEIAEIAAREDVAKIIVGLPRNQSGEATEQTSFVLEFAKKLDTVAEIEFQDESLTSVIAEDRLKQRGAAYTRADIDAEAAVIILQDYIEQHA